MMQSAVSVSFFRPEFNDFLYAPIGVESNEMPLSVLSALARLNIDPWLEAAALSELPRKGATQRLATLVARLPGWRWTQEDCEAIAERLTKLLPHRRESDTTVANEATAHPGVPQPPSALQLIYGAIAIVFLIIAASGGLSVWGDHLDTPPIGTDSPARTPPASH